MLTCLNARYHSCFMTYVDDTAVYRLQAMCAPWAWPGVCGVACWPVLVRAQLPLYVPGQSSPQPTMGKANILFEHHSIMKPPGNRSIIPSSYHGEDNTPLENKRSTAQTSPQVIMGGQHSIRKQTANRSNIPSTYDLQNRYSVWTSLYK